MASVAIDDRGIPPDEAASRLFQEHSEWLLAFCTRQLRDRADAEDAVQATFLYAFRALRSGVVPECERAWLTTIAKNVCHTHRRTSGRRPESALEADLDRIALAQPDLEEVGFMDDVRAALSSLPVNQRRALLRREWQGVPSSEIADELHLSGPATDALLFRARKSFASAMSASGRPFAGLNVLILFEQLRGWLKPLLGGAAVKAAVATTAASVVVGGVVIERQRSDSDAPPPTRPPSAATVGATRDTSPAPGVRATTPVVTRRGQVAPPAEAATSRPVHEAAASGPTETDTTVTRVARPKKDEAAPAAAAPSPRPPSPTPVPPIDPPVPAPPVDLPPVLGEEPPVQLPPPAEDVLPPVAVPPLPLPPLPTPLPPLDKGLPLVP